MPKPEIFAVIWNDFIPLSLHCANAQQAIEKAIDMRSRATAAGMNVEAMDIRTVRLAADSDALEIIG